MKKLLFILPLFISVFLFAGCSKLGQSVECTKNDGTKFTEKIIGETNTRLLVIVNNDNNYITYEKRGEWNRGRNNCKKFGKERHPKMLSGYEQYIDYLK